MDNNPLDNLLAALAKESLPSSPGSLEGRVWREIRARRARPSGVMERLAGVTAGWWQWKPAYAAVATAVAVGVLMGHLSHEPVPSLADLSTTQTGESLGLTVFSADPPAMPSTLLAHRP